MNLLPPVCKFVVRHDELCDRINEYLAESELRARNAAHLSQIPPDLFYEKSLDLELANIRNSFGEIDEELQKKKCQTGIYHNQYFDDLQKDLAEQKMLKAKENKE